MAVVAAKFRKIITAEIQKLKEKIELLEEAAKPVAPDNAIGRLSRMEAIGEKSVNEANLSRSKMRMLQLEQALKRIDDGEYGICAICEEPIAQRRLELLPESTICVDCLEQRQED